MSYGRLSAEAACAAREASVKGAPVDWLRLVRIAPLPGSALDMALDYDRVVFFEEGVLRGGVAEQSADSGENTKPSAWTVDSSRQARYSSSLRCSGLTGNR